MNKNLDFLFGIFTISMQRLLSLIKFIKYKNGKSHTNIIQQQKWWKNTQIFLSIEKCATADYEKHQ